MIWIVDGKTDFYYKDGNLLHVKKSNKLHSVYLKMLLEDEINTYKRRMSSGTAYAALTISALKEIIIDVPPLSLQEEFAAFVQKVDKTKAEVKQSLEKLETLKKSLMQEYFG